MVLLNIAGSVALILFGIRFLRKGLDRLLGHRLHSWLERMSRRRWTAALAGGVFGTVAPSSTAQTLLTLQLLNAGRLAPQSMLAFLLGANVGITVTVQLIAFRFFDYHAIFIIAGLIGYQYLKNETVRGIGQALMGLGFIFLAMSLASEATRQLGGNADFNTIIGILQNYPLILVCFAAVLTFATQSSTAGIGLALAAAEGGDLTLRLMLPVVLGANLGLGITSLIVGMRTWEGRRLGLANLVLKGAAVIVGLALLGTFERVMGGTPGSLLRQTADFHTAFNVVVLLVGMALAGPLARLMQRTVKPAESSALAMPSVATHLEASALASPVFALANASRETLRLADEVKAMLEGCWRAIQTGDVELARHVRQHDDRVDELNSAIKQYLSQIAPDAMTPRDEQLRFGLLNFSSQLESIADIIDKQMCSHAERRRAGGLTFSMEDEGVLTELHARVTRRMDVAISVLATRDRGLARKFLEEGDALKEWCIEVQKAHYARLSTASGAMASSTHFLDLVNSLRRISGQLNTIGHTFAMTRPTPAAPEGAPAAAGEARGD
ncbi:Na/Pi cotransporter family protein [Horticoccus luteus]|uniref:Na/Pi cotransporter family protein n=1 Tax=Horticoccus luteus TaxID=2862869 RepID=A0A8F9XGJ1_9BACT|nr:Na/Pi cotransporter family protein [Horticoccus luteus]QYM78280.1 Na/Pi cotransporter family protein [Horticoccus luteus]